MLSSMLSGTIWTVFENSSSLKAMSENDIHYFQNIVHIQHVSGVWWFPLLKDKNNSIASGHDDVPSFLLRDCVSAFAKLLTKLINLLLELLQISYNW